MQGTRGCPVPTLAAVVARTAAAAELAAVASDRAAHARLQHAGAGRGWARAHRHHHVQHDADVEGQHVSSGSSGGEDGGSERRQRDLLGGHLAELVLEDELTRGSNPA